MNRNELADLTRLESLLLQLKTLRRVPAELRQFMAKRDFGSAVLLYSKAQRLLQSHGHHGLLRGVAAESEEIMQVRALAGFCIEHLLWANFACVQLRQQLAPASSSLGDELDGSAFTSSSFFRSLLLAFEAELSGTLGTS